MTSKLLFMLAFAMIASAFASASEIAITPNTSVLRITDKISRDGPQLSVEAISTESPSNWHYEIRITVHGNPSQVIPIRNGQALKNTDLQLVDLNADGFLDIMIASGHDHRDKPWFKTWIYSQDTKQYQWLDLKASADPEIEEAESALTAASDIQEFGPNDDPLPWKLNEAIRDDDIPTVESLIKAGVSVNDEPTKRHGHRHTSRPICAAAHHGRTAVGLILLKNGADPNSIESSGESALWIAAKRGHLEFVKLLLASGAEVNGSRGLMHTPMDAVNERIRHFQSIKEVLEENGGMTYHRLQEAQKAQKGSGGNGKQR